MIVFDETGNEVWGCEAEVTSNVVEEIMRKLFEFLQIEKPKNNRLTSMFQMGEVVKDSRDPNFKCDKVFKSPDGTAVRFLYSVTVDFSLRIYFDNLNFANKFISFLAKE